MLLFSLLVVFLIIFYYSLWLKQIIGEILLKTAIWTYFRNISGISCKIKLIIHKRGLLKGGLAFCDIVVSKKISKEIFFHVSIKTLKIKFCSTGDQPNKTLGFSVESLKVLYFKLNDIKKEKVKKTILKNRKKSWFSKLTDKLKLNFWPNISLEINTLNLDLSSHKTEFSLKSKNLKLDFVIIKTSVTRFTAKSLAETVLLQAKTEKNSFSSKIENVSLLLEGVYASKVALNEIENSSCECFYSLMLKKKISLEAINVLVSTFELDVVTDKTKSFVSKDSQINFEDDLEQCGVNFKECEVCSHVNEPQSLVCTVCNSKIFEQCRDGEGDNKVEYADKDTVAKDCFILWHKCVNSISVNVKEMRLSSSINGEDGVILASVELPVKVQIQRIHDRYKSSFVDCNSGVIFSPSDIDYFWGLIVLFIPLFLNEVKFRVFFNDKIVASLTIYELSLFASIEQSIYGLEWETNHHQNRLDEICKGMMRKCDVSNLEEGFVYPKDAWACVNCSFLNSANDKSCAVCSADYEAHSIPDSSNDSREAKVNKYSLIPTDHKHGINVVVESHCQNFDMNLSLEFFDCLQALRNTPTSSMPSKKSKAELYYWLNPFFIKPTLKTLLIRTGFTEASITYETTFANLDLKSKGIGNLSKATLYLTVLQCCLEVTVQHSLNLLSESGSQKQSLTQISSLTIGKIEVGYLWSGKDKCILELIEAEIRLLYKISMPQGTIPVVCLSLRQMSASELSIGFFEFTLIRLCLEEMKHILLPPKKRNTRVIKRSIRPVDLFNVNKMLRLRLHLLLTIDMPLLVLNICTTNDASVVKIFKPNLCLYNAIAKRNLNFNCTETKLIISKRFNFMSLTDISINITHNDFKVIANDLVLKIPEEEAIGFFCHDLLRLRKLSKTILKRVLSVKSRKLTQVGRRSQSLDLRVISAKCLLDKVNGISLNIQILSFHLNLRYLPNSSLLQERIINLSTSSAKTSKNIQQNGYSFCNGLIVHLAKAQSLNVVLNNTLNILEVNQVHLGKELFIGWAQLSANSSAYSTSQDNFNSVVVNGLTHNSNKVKVYIDVNLTCAKVSAKMCQLYFHDLLELRCFFTNFIPKSREKKLKQIRLSWWNNLRYLLHGLFTAHVGIFQIKIGEANHFYFDIFGLDVSNRRPVVPTLLNDVYSCSSDWHVNFTSLKIFFSANQRTDLFLKLVNAQLIITFNWKIIKLTNTKYGYFEHEVYLFKPAHTKDDGNIDIFRLFRPNYLELIFNLTSVSLDIFWDMSKFVEVVELFFFLISNWHKTKPKRIIVDDVPSKEKFLQSLKFYSQLTSLRCIIGRNEREISYMELYFKNFTLVVCMTGANDSWRKDKIDVSNESLEVNFLRLTENNLHKSTNVGKLPLNFLDRNFTQAYVDKFSLNLDKNSWFISLNKANIKLSFDENNHENVLIITAELFKIKYNVESRNTFIHTYRGLLACFAFLSNRGSKSQSKTSMPWTISIVDSQVRMEQDTDVLLLMIPQFKIASTTTLIPTKRYILEARINHGSVFTFNPDSKFFNETSITGWFSRDFNVHWNRVINDLDFAITYEKNSLSVEDELKSGSKILFAAPSISCSVESKDFFILANILRSVILEPLPKEKNKDHYLQKQVNVVVDETTQLLESKSILLYGRETFKSFEDLFASTTDVNKAVKQISRAAIEKSSSKVTEGGKRLIDYDIGKCSIHMLDDSPQEDSSSAGIIITIVALRGSHVFDNFDFHYFSINVKDIFINSVDQAEIFAGHLSNNTGQTSLILTVEADALPVLKLNKHVAIALYRKWSVNIFKGLSYKFRLSLTPDVTEFLSNFFKDEELEEDVSFVNPKAAKTEVDNISKENATFMKRFKTKVPFAFVSNFENKGSVVITSGWLRLIKYKERSDETIYKAYWCDLEMLANKVARFSLYRNQKRLRYSKKSFCLSELVSINLERQEKEFLLHISTYNRQFCFGKMDSTGTTSSNALFWAASILPLTKSEIYQSSLVSEVFAHRYLAEQYERVSLINKDWTLANEKTDNKPEKSTTYLFFNHVKIGKIKLELSLENIRLHNSVPFEVSGSYTLLVSEFHLHSQLLSWKGLYRTYRFHAIKGVLRSLLLGQTKEKKDDSEKQT